MNIHALKEVSLRLKKANIVHALGGSGLLYSLGLTETVNDWDITTDAPIETVKNVLKNLDYKHVSGNQIFDSNYLFKINFQETNFDLIGGFAIQTPNGSYRVPTIITGEWEGVPLGSPAAWAKAYELMGRPEKSKLLLDYISSQFK